MSKKQEKLLQQIVTQLNHRMHSVVDRYTWQQNELMDVLLWIGCPMAQYDQQMSPEGRVYAHTNHVPFVVCVCEEISKVTPPYLYGMMTHEFGHIFSFALGDDYSEASADDVAYDLLGIRIYYGERNIQYLKQEDIDLLGI